MRSSNFLHRSQLWILRRLYRRSYRDFYRHFMRLRAKQDPKEAVGGLWEELGLLQFEFLKSRGLQPMHTLLDIGCGSLRAGRHFIGYLEPGHYTGIDISEHIIRQGAKLLPPSLVEQKRPRLQRNRDLELKEFPDRSFDFVLAQSVFTHMPEADIRECLCSVPRVLRPGGRFYFTAFLGEDKRYVAGLENFFYPEAAIRSFCSAAGLLCRHLDDFVHPRGQAMFEASLR